MKSDCLDKTMRFRGKRREWAVALSLAEKGEELARSKGFELTGRLAARNNRRLVAGAEYFGCTDAHHNPYQGRSYEEDKSDGENGSP